MCIEGRVVKNHLPLFYFIMRFVSHTLSYAAAVFLAAMSVSCSSGTAPDVERPQWTEKQAWEWDRKIGVIKGFNQPEGAFPGMTQDDILRKMSSLGFNSVRFWIGGETAEDQVDRIQKIADCAEKYGMTVSPVLYLHRNYLHRDASPEDNLRDAEENVRKIVRPFKDDPRIALWDLWNEPVFEASDSSNVMLEMDWLEREVHWCRQERLSQPITASIFWDTEMTSDTTSALFQRRKEVEQMMDLHNFHDYMCAEHFGEDARVMIGKMEKMGNRPLVCTECLTRVNGSGVGRTMAEFASGHVHFYIWGSYANDANWEVKWGRSTYDSYDEMFHNIMYSDGDLIDSREIEYIRNFKFVDRDASADPGLEVTERWTHERAWKRMAGGPVKGQTGLLRPSSGYNSIRVKFDYADYAADRESFFSKVDGVLRSAEAGRYTVLPVLVSDADIAAGQENLSAYVADVVGRYYCSPEIQAWDLYYHPGETAGDRQKVSELVTAIFRYARNEYPNQPLTATPAVKVREFAPDFDYRAALVHGHRNGWNMLEYPGCSDPDLVYGIWCLSDVISFSSDQPAAETGWLASICYKFGRPVFCTDLASPTSADVETLMDLFQDNHIHFYTENPVPLQTLTSFSFRPIITRH